MKKLLFRISDDTKRDMRVVLAKEKIGMQHYLESCVERLIDYDNGRMDDKSIKSIEKILDRARTLSTHVL